MLRCQRCDFANPPHARFCGRCGAAPAADLGAAPCPGCGMPLPAGAALCPRCQRAKDEARASGERRHLPVGAVVAGRYTLARRLGSGGMGAVHEVSDARLGGKRWALKEMSSAGLDGVRLAEAARAFAHEATLLAHLEHPNLPRVIDFFSEGDRHFLVMEYVEGVTLADALADAGGSLPEGRVVAWAMQIQAVLAYLHGRRPPIIFRDLKPANVMLTPEERIRLIDFGIARLFKQGQRHDTASLGTHGYAAPEVYGQGQSDARSDVYSLGATLHYLLTGDDPSAHAFIFPAARTLRPTLSPAIDAIIAQAVRLDPRHRFQSVDAMGAALARLPTTQVPTRRVVPGPPPTRPPAAAPSNAEAAARPGPPSTTQSDPPAGSRGESGRAPTSERAASAESPLVPEGAAHAPRCPRCAAPLPARAAYCWRCGQQLSGTLAYPTRVLCPRCGKPAAAGTTYCGGCGAALPPRLSPQ